jgi:hypothetical protein
VDRARPPNDVEELVNDTDGSFAKGYCLRDGYKYLQYSDFPEWLLCSFVITQTTVYQLKSLILL